MRKPKVSVITATYNDKENLRRIVRQVSAQDYENIEYIIVDGGSSDGTLDVIREAQEIFGERLKWISEPDKGIYDAINKGIRMATGEILGCCFDEYAGTDVLSKMAEIMEREKTDGVHGDLYYMEGDRIVRRWHQGTGASSLWLDAGTSDALSEKRGLRYLRPLQDRLPDFSRL